MAAPMTNAARQKIGQKLLIKQFTWMRHIQTSTNSLGKTKFQKMTKKTNRYMARKINYEHGNARKKKIWYDTPAAFGASDLMKTRSGPSIGSQKRAQHVSVVLYEYITSMINSGEIDQQLVDLGLDIVKVKMASDFSHINVYWLASGSDKDKLLEPILTEAAYKLRTDLVKLNLIGNLPPIKFVKDFSVARLETVEELLSVADMGPDHEPTELGADMKSELQLLNKHRSTVQQNMNSVASKFLDSADSTEGPGGVREILPRERHKMVTGSSTTLEGYKTSESVKSETKHAMDDFRNSDRFHEAPLESDTDESNVSKIEHKLNDLNLQSDVYGIDHGQLMQQLIHNKQRLRHRGLPQMVPSKIDEPQTKTDDFKQFLSNRRKTMKTRNLMNYNLSSSTHMDDSEAGMTDEYDVNDEEEDYMFYEDYEDEIDDRGEKNP